MTTVIVPVDFSETSLNAARYAAGFLRGEYGVTILLYHSCDSAAEAAEGEAKLASLKASLMAEFPVKFDVLVHQEADFVNGLERAARHRKADLIIMGITGKSAIQQVLFGSNTLKMVETKACPVLIVPEEAKFEGMKNALLTSDFKDTLNTTPSAHIKSVLSVYNPKLHVVNVNKDHYISLTQDYEKEKSNLRSLLADYYPEFYFMRLFEVDEALNMFVNDFSIDMMIAVQRNRSFLEKLLRPSYTKKLSFQTKVPILVIHE